MLRILLCVLFIFSYLFISEGQDQYPHKFPPEFVETTWDQGVPVILENERVMKLIRDVLRYSSNCDQCGFIMKKLDVDSILNPMYSELGNTFYEAGMLEGAQFYMSKIGPNAYLKMIKIKKHKYENEKRLWLARQPKKDLVLIAKELPKEEIKEVPKQMLEPKKDAPKDGANIIMSTIMDIVQETAPGKPVVLDLNMTKKEEVELKQDQAVVNNLPKQYDKIPATNLKNINKKIKNEISILEDERDMLIKQNANQFLISSKENAIKALEKENDIIAEKIKANEIESEKDKNTRIFILTITILVVIALGIFIYFQRKTIKLQDGEIGKQLEDINEKNAYLEYAASLIRHDMHSGINTYIPRGLVSLEKRISEDEVEKLKIGPALRMMKEGLSHTQKVYKKVHEFTSLVKSDAQLDKNTVDVKDLLSNYFEGTAFKSQIEISELSTLEVNETLFCTAIDNLVKNGIKYNDSKDKKVKIYKENGCIIIEDNGRGLSTSDFRKLTSAKRKGVVNKEGGLGLHICIAILKEHNFKVDCELITENSTTKGTKIKITT